MPKPLQPSTPTFRDLIEGGYLYVDKTYNIYELIRGTKGIYFLSRPRRFGKSLFISTLEEIFKGNRELFKGLWLYESEYSWEKHPVIRLDFSRIAATSSDELQEGIKRHLRRIARQYSIELPDGSYAMLLDELIFELSAVDQVVILIDEYDKPLIDNLDHLEMAQAIRDTLRSFYTILKAMDEYIRFVFITGISKFSKVGVFSTMNNLEDMTMDPAFATAFGITEDELQSYFGPHIQAFAQRENISEEKLVQQVREWYDGFCFVEECERVYNPFSTIQLFKKQRFSNYWFDSGTPTFLINLLKTNNYSVESLEKLVLKEIDFSTYELEHLDIVPLLFQTGYLTIKDYEKVFGEETVYHLSYPNREVENAFITYLLSAFSYIDRTLSRSHLYKLMDALQKRDMEQMFLVLRVFFANIPYTLKVKKEAYYQTIFYVIFKMIGIETEAEVVTNDGRIDAVVELADQIFIFEFKLDGTVEDALAQIRKKEYFQKYWLKGKPILCVGANFSTDTRTVEAWDIETDFDSP